MYVFFLLILLLPMLALRPRRAEDGGVLDPKSTTCIKGILCIYVMLHNLGLDLENGEFKELVCEHAGGVGVGLFFFLSAFGIIRSYQSRGNKYLIKLLFVHIPKLWAVAVFINALTYLSFLSGAFEPTDTWLRILNLDIFNGFNRINRHGWYIASIIALYLIFALVYFACSKLKNSKKYVNTPKRILLTLKKPLDKIPPFLTVVFFALFFKFLVFIVGFFILKFIS